MRINLFVSQRIVTVSCFLGMSLLTSAQTGYKIVNAQSGLVVDVRGYSTANGAAIQQWTWNAPADPKQQAPNNANQLWGFISTTNGYYGIGSLNGETPTNIKVLDVPGFATTPADLQQWDWLQGTNQQWRFVPQSSSYYSIINLNSQMALDVGLGGQGSPVYQYNYYGGLPQQWEIEPVQYNRWFTTSTSIFYSSSGNTVEVYTSMDQDYGSAYY